MLDRPTLDTDRVVALLAEGVDRNTVLTGQGGSIRSPSSRRAWIEIRQEYQQSVCSWVALLAEGVDRNRKPRATPPRWKVALLAEGVDRNFFVPNRLLWEHWSPSSRRAWIEILLGDHFEDVRKSPSSRRAWIEIGI